MYNRDGKEKRDGYDVSVWSGELVPPRPPLSFLHSGNTPKWSPNGITLGVISDRGDNGAQIFLSAPDGKDGNGAALTRVAGDVSSFEWSSDGLRVLFIATRRVDPSLKGKRGPPGAGDGPHVVWRLPYKAEGTGYTLNREYHLFVVEATGGEAKQLTDGPFDIGSARFSPEGHPRERRSVRTHG